jgi:ubiquinone/menaquinone biosynthesis C-methylase UbiE
MEIINPELFERLISEALQQKFSGWDFRYIANRWVEGPISWDYARMAREHMKPEGPLLDMDTGGGEFLSSLQPLPHTTFATEGYLPNVPVARNRLEPLGVKVVQLFEGKEKLPFSDNFFDLVLNRHGSFSATEVQRILKPNGVFITQQVGGENNFQINELLQEHPEFKYSYRTLKRAVGQLVSAGFQILEQMEEFPETTILDVGALVYHLKVISWQIADFSVEKYYEELAEIHNTIQKEGSLKIKSHRFLMVAKKS